MNADTLARLTREAEAPEGIAVRVSGPEMKRLLEERAELLKALRKAPGDSGCDGDLCMHYWHELARGAIAMADEP